jgi:hypothetical protein
MAEVFSDDLNLQIGDLLSHPLYPATRKPCARPFMLMRPIQANSCMFARAPVHACAPASRARPFLRAIFSHALSRVFQEPKTLPEYKHFELSDPLSPSREKNKYFLFKHRHLEAGLFLALPRCAPPPIASPRLSHHSTCTPPFASRISTKKHLAPPPFPAHPALNAASPEPLEAHDVTEKTTKKPKLEKPGNYTELTALQTSLTPRYATPPIASRITSDTSSGANAVSCTI